MFTSLSVLHISLIGISHGGFPEVRAGARPPADLYLSSAPGPALEDDVLFPSLFTFCFLSLILMRTDLGVEPSTRWKYQIRPSGDRTPRKCRSPPDTGPDRPLQPRFSGRDSEPDSRPLSASGMSETRIELGTFDPRALYNIKGIVFTQHLWCG